jgi:hypothetical protein
MPAGRPTRYKKEYCDQVIQFMAEGLSFEAFAGELGVSKECLYRWCDVHPEFMLAKKKGQAKSRKFYESMARAMAAGKLKGSAAMLIFIMKNRLNWTDKQELSANENLKDLVLNYKL